MCPSKRYRLPRAPFGLWIAGPHVEADSWRRRAPRPPENEISWGYPLLVAAQGVARVGTQARACGRIQYPQYGQQARPWHILRVQRPYTSPTSPRTENWRTPPGHPNPSGMANQMQPKFAAQRKAVRAVQATSETGPKNDRQSDIKRIRSISASPRLAYRLSVVSGWRSGLGRLRRHGGPSGPTPGSAVCSVVWFVGLVA